MALVTNVDGPNILDESYQSCENEVKEDLEDGEIFDDDDGDTEMVESTEQNTESKVSNENCFGGGSKDDNFEPPWDMDQRPHKKMSHGVSNKPFAGFNNSRPRGERFTRHKGAMMKRDVGYPIDDERPRRKRRRFDQVDEKDSMLRNNQNGMFNRKNNDGSAESNECADDEEMYVRGSSPDVSNFDTFPREFENEGEDFRLNNNFGRRGRGKRGGGCDLDRRGRGLSGKRRLGIGHTMKNKRPEDEDKICQYFLQGKCLKENNCTYSHQQPNGRKMELCKFYLMDCCSKDDRCTFMHSEFPCKYYHTGMKCYSGPKCRFSHAKLDEDQKKILLKSFGKLRYDPPDYENENQDFPQNKFEEEPKPNVVENNFNSKCDMNKIPSLLEMQIPVPVELKNTEEDSESNNNNNGSTPMPSPSRDESIVDDTFEINEIEQPNVSHKSSGHKSKRHHEKNKNKDKQMHKKEMKRMKKLEEKQMEKNRQQNEDLTINTNDHPLLDDMSDDDEYNDLVIDEEKFNNDGKDQQLPKKQKELLKRIQVTQKFYDETVMNESSYNLEEQYSSDVSDHSVSTPFLITSSQSEEEKEPSPASSLSKQCASKVEKVDLTQITISDDMAKLLNSIKAHIGSDKSSKEENSSPFHLPPMEQHYNFEETIQEDKKNIEESPASPTSNESNVMELGKSDIDLRQLPFQFPVAAATEIDASLDSHPPIKYQLSPAQVSVPDYSKIPPTMGIDDPRLRLSMKAARDPMFMHNVVSAPGNVSVRPSAAPSQKSAPRDPRKQQQQQQQQDVNACASAVRTPLLPTPNPIVQQRPMDSDMRHMPPPIMCPQMMAVPNDPRRKPIVPGDPRQRHRFDVDQRINNMNYF